MGCFSFFFRKKEYNSIMKIGIDASFLRKPDTGIGQVTVNFLRKLGSLANARAENLRGREIVLYLKKKTEESFSGYFKKRIFLPFYRRDDLVREIWWENFSLPRKAKKDQCDAFISLYQGTTILRNMEVKHIMVVHDIIPKLFPQYLNNSRKKLYWRLTERAIRKADKIIAVSRRTEKDLVQFLGIDPAKITVAYPDVDEIYKKPVETRRNASVLKKYELKPGYIYCGGGLEVRKNVEGAIRAYQRLTQRSKTDHILPQLPPLVISGKLMPQLAPLVTDAEKLIKKLNLTQRVKLLGFVPQKDLPALYKNALFFVYPSYYEGFGLPVLEAMNVGTPVVTSKTSSLPEVGRDAVLYCKPEDIEDLAQVMKNLLLNVNLRTMLSLRSKERAKYFSWEKFVNKILNVLA
jgi:glycosyltransferase involved in cell wall biosynthesis